ncbi:MAG: hypothetical protein HYS98_03220 [Deltaproteobacteria bacterium]|nr:hypothetical protein [Deltaproteobacteria bacterium]
MNDLRLPSTVKSVIVPLAIVAPLVFNLSCGSSSRRVFNLYVENKTPDGKIVPPDAGSGGDSNGSPDTNPGGGGTPGSPPNGGSGGGSAPGTNPGEGGTPGGGGGGNPDPVPIPLPDPTQPGGPTPPDFQLYEEDFYYGLPSGKLSILFVVDTSEPMEDIHSDLVLASTKFAPEFLSNNLSHLQYKIGFMPSDEARLISVSGKNFISTARDFAVFPQFMSQLGYQGQPHILSYSKTLELLHNSADFREEDALSVFFFISSDELSHDIATSHFLSQIHKIYRPPYLSVFTALFRMNIQTCPYSLTKTSDKLEQLSHQHFYGHRLDLCELLKKNTLSDVAQLSLSYTKRIILKKIPHTFDGKSFKVLYNYYPLLMGRDFTYDTQKNEIILTNKPKVPQGGKITVLYGVKQDPQNP